MKATVTWWDLDGSAQTIDSLRADLDDGGTGAWAAVAGLRLKFWIADRQGNRWGAVMVWDSPPRSPLPPNRAVELIGYPPTERVEFDVEAVVGGPVTGWPT